MADVACVQLRINKTDGSCLLEIEAFLSWSVLDVKKQVTHAEGVPCQEQKLLLDDRELIDTVCLSAVLLVDTSEGVDLTLIRSFRAYRFDRLGEMNAPTSIDQLTMRSCIWRSFFHEVWQAECLVDGSSYDFAVKQVRLSLINEHRLMDKVRREVGILYSIDHPRCNKLFFDFFDSEYMYLGMEFTHGGTLFDRLHSVSRFTNDIAARYFLETCEALAYLHHLPEKLLHRDIRPENILLTEDDHVKLTDFSWAATLMEGSLRTTFCGTLDYLAPEMILGNGHNESVDMWCMGVLLYELVTGQAPFGSNSKEETCRRILRVDLHFPEEIDATAEDLVSKLCKKNPVKRLTAEEAMQHSYVVAFCDVGTDPAVPVAVRPAEGSD